MCCFTNVRQQKPFCSGQLLYSLCVLTVEFQKFDNAYGKIQPSCVVAFLLFVLHKYNLSYLFLPYAMWNFGNSSKNTEG